MSQLFEKLFADVSHEVAGLLDGALSGKELTADGAERLLQAEGADFHALLRAGATGPISSLHGSKGFAT